MTNAVVDLREMAPAEQPVRREVVEKFVRLLAEAAGTRAIAAGRLVRRDKRMAELAVASSIYLVLLTVLPYMLTIPAEVTSHLDFVRILLSLLVLVSVLFQRSSGHDIKAEQLRRSSSEISELQRETELRKDKLGLDDLDILRIRYDNILQKYLVQQERSDILEYQIENKDKYPEITNISAFIMSMEISIQHYGLRLLLYGVSIVALLLIVSLFGSYPVRLPT